MIAYYGLDYYLFPKIANGALGGAAGVHEASVIPAAALRGCGA
jgi:hypothetical protein